MVAGQVFVGRRTSLRAGSASQVFARSRTASEDKDAGHRPEDGASVGHAFKTCLPHQSSMSFGTTPDKSSGLPTSSIVWQNPGARALPAVFKTDCGTFATRNDESERASDQRFRVSTIPIDFHCFPANHGPNADPLPLVEGLQHLALWRVTRSVPAGGTDPYGGPKTGTRKTGWMWPRSRTLISAATACITGLALGQGSVPQGPLDFPLGHSRSSRQRLTRRLRKGFKLHKPT